FHIFYLFSSTFLIFSFFFYCYGDHRDLHSFPTRRSSDLQWVIYIYNLPAPPADKDYQLWYLTSDQNKVSAAVFRTDAQGRGELRSEEHTSELQSRGHLVCRLLLEKKKKKKKNQ